MPLATSWQPAKKSRGKALLRCSAVGAFEFADQAHRLTNRDVQQNLRLNGETKPGLKQCLYC